MAVLHIHDEAAVRLRSFAKDDAAAPGRGRSSSVQCHVVNLFAAPGAQHPILVELDPLASKSGESLATSLNNVFLPLAALARRGVDAVAADAPIFLVHVLVCDAVSANEKAARILLARHTSVAPAAEVHYFLMMVNAQTTRRTSSSTQPWMGSQRRLARGRPQRRWRPGPLTRCRSGTLATTPRPRRIGWRVGRSCGCSNT